LLAGDIEISTHHLALVIPKQKFWDISRFMEKSQQQKKFYIKQPRLRLLKQVIFMHSAIIFFKLIRVMAYMSLIILYLLMQNGSVLLKLRDVHRSRSKMTNFIQIVMMTLSC